MSVSRKVASVGASCVACGKCAKECPVDAISVYKGMYAVVDEPRCVGCARCAKACPAGVISIIPTNTARARSTEKVKPKKRHWYDYLWIYSAAYLILGFFNILFAWLGMICFLTPLLISMFGGGKAYCNKYCGRGQLFELIGGKFKLSLMKEPPKFLSSKWFRYGFLCFFMTMFGLMIYNTYLVFLGAPLKEVVTLLWVFKLPWHWTHTAFVSPWIAKFSFGLYGVMLTSSILGLVTMLAFKPRSWCVYCPMGTMTQGISVIRHGKEDKDGGKG